MEALISRVERVRSDPLVRGLVEERMRGFDRIRDEGPDRLFLELSFCLLTANFQSAKSIAIQDEIGTGFLTLSAVELETRLRSLGYRFPRVRAGFIVEARAHRDALPEVVYGPGLTDVERRDWLAANVKGLGLKEASHFLRNVGVPAFPIVDRHIVRVLHESGVIDAVPKSITKRAYLRIESAMDELARATDLDHGRLDYYLWYLVTGSVLK